MAQHTHELLSAETYDQTSLRVISGVKIES